MASNRGGDTDEANPWRDEIVATIFGSGVGEIKQDFSCAIERTILLQGRMYVWSIPSPLRTSRTQSGRAHDPTAAAQPRARRIGRSRSPPRLPTAAAPLTPSAAATPAALTFPGMLRPSSFAFIATYSASRRRSKFHSPTSFLSGGRILLA